jgi:hypothetical protein
LFEEGIKLKNTGCMVNLGGMYEEGSAGLGREVNY